MSCFKLFSLLSLLLAWPLHAFSAPPEDLLQDFDSYRLERNLEAAQALQDLGEAQAVAWLQSWAEQHPDDLSTFVMCRMLFQGKDDAPLRRPALGGPVFVGAGSLDDWPLEPITLFEGIPILVVRGYMLGGHPESAQDYLAYCIQNGSWVSGKYALPTPEEVDDALTRFIEQYDLTEEDARFIRAQAE
ncbi:MAG: hypothetical protein RBU37_12770 [Myxococcota bacterium]|jgi:hypothetical protein|nr:hypothetical protein [Myxococcota bacterium]